MSEDPAAARPPKGGLEKWAIPALALTGVAVGLYIIVSSLGDKTAAPTAEAPQVACVPGSPAAKTWACKYAPVATPTSGPDFAFKGPDGADVKVADFKGKVLVMNLWATWCAPCKIEMPSLAKLAAAYEGQPVEVLALSVDGPDKTGEAKTFIAENAPLKFYQDPTMGMSFELTPPAPGMPTTIVYGKDGLEVGRVAGEVDWTGPEARALIDKALAG